MSRGARGVLMVAGSCIALLLVGEAAARLAHGLGRYHPKTVNEQFVQRNPYLYQVLKPGVYLRDGARIEVNSLGFRGAEFSPKKPPGVYRIFVLGGSTTFGYSESIPRTEDTYPYKLQVALRARLATPAVEVINAGVIGYTLRTSLVNFATRLTWYEPDLLVVYHGVNDAIAIRDEQDLFRGVVAADPGPTLWQSLSDRSFLLLEANFQAVRLLRRSAARGSLPSDTPLPATLAAYERNLRSLVDLAASQGVAVVIGNESVAVPESCEGGRLVSEADRALRPIEARVCFAIQWYFPHLTPRGLARTFEALAAIQRRVAGEKGLVWVDMNPVVPRTAEYYWDFCHTRPSATTLIARAFADAVTPLVRPRGRP